MKPQPFSAGDWWVLLIYLVLTLGMGFYFARGAKSYSKFMFGSGAVPWWAIGISLIATSLSSTSFLGPPEAAYTGDMRLLMYQVGAFLSIILCGKIFIPFIRRHAVSSAYEILEEHFDGKTRLLASGLYCLHVLLRVGVLIYGPALVLSEVLGIQVHTCILLIGIVAVVYTYFGGMEAVIWTDVLQFLVLLGGSFFVITYMTSEGDTLGALWQLSAEAGHAKIWDFTFDLSSAANFWTLGLAVVVVETAVRSTDQQFVQRYLCCRDVKDAQNGNYLSWLLGFIFIGVFLSIGVLLYGFYYRHPDLLPAGSDPSRVFPQFFIEQLPVGITGALVAGLFAAAMSSLDSALTALSNTTVVDFLPKMFPGMGEARRLRLGRLCILGFGALGIAAGFYVSRTQTDLLTTALRYTSLMTGPLLGLFTLALLKRKTHGSAAFVAALLGALSILPFNPALISPSPSDLLFSPVVKVAWPLYPVIGSGVTILLGLVLTPLFSRGQK